MNCSYDEVAELYIETEYTARKEHKCCECNSIIKPGDYYTKIKMLYDGDWTTDKQCSNCAEVFGVIRQSGGCPYVGGLAEEIINTWEDIDPKIKSYLLKRVPDMILECLREIK